MSNGWRQNWFCPAMTSLLVTLVVSTSTASEPGGLEQDWIMRSRGPGVFFAENFSGIRDDSALRRLSFFNHKLNETRLFLEVRNALSGGGAVRIEIHPEDNEVTATFAHSFDGSGARSKRVVKKELYYQFSIYLPNYILDHRFKTVNDVGNVGHKWCILQEPDRSFDKGQVVITNMAFTRAVGAYTVGPRGTHGFEREWPAGSGNPCRPETPDYQWQPAVDAGPQSEHGGTDADNCDLFRRRYGMLYSHYKKYPVIYGRGTVSQQGYPDPESSRNGIFWIPDTWNVIEIYVSEPAQTVKIWHARRGDPPRLVVEAIGSANLGSRAGNYTGVQLLPRLEEMAPDLARKRTYAIYDELIASQDPIPFPGGHRIE